MEKCRNAPKTPRKLKSFQEIQERYVLTIRKMQSRSFWDGHFLTWHVCRANFSTKYFFLLRIFLRKLLRKFIQNVSSLHFVCQKKFCKIPVKFTFKKKKKRASAGAQGELFRGHLMVVLVHQVTRVKNFGQPPKSWKKQAYW